ncbi:Uncharacterised protein [Serratia marcescens]|uniref:Uncharacterized protein n=1 Tax=Serratia marcescens TaxID=615 RepID=A0A656VH43_SERMA|nr:hypothetical protein AB868_02368 [Serratia marcescens]BEO32255.1 hypothetical protein SMQE01_10200 [Serratia marcescens]CAI1593620.1 Uncharacterised protein [Serratia marcescens]CAI2535788.1 Uncharacterised protein [Serratia marcescens]CVE05483.1 Uncharacterised protein [Serratia marcescens]
MGEDISVKGDEIRYTQHQCQRDEIFHNADGG